MRGETQRSQSLSLFWAPCGYVYNHLSLSDGATMCGIVHSEVPQKYQKYHVDVHQVSAAILCVAAKTKTVFFFVHLLWKAVVCISWNRRWEGVCTRGEADQGPIWQSEIIRNNSIRRLCELHQSEFFRTTVSARGRFRFRNPSMPELVSLSVSATEIGPLPSYLLWSPSPALLC